MLHKPNCCVQAREQIWRALHANGICPFTTTPLKSCSETEMGTLRLKKGTRIIIEATAARNKVWLPEKTQWLQRTLVAPISFSRAFLEPEYIICSSGLHPASERKLIHWYPSNDKSSTPKTIMSGQLIKRRLTQS